MLLFISVEHKMREIPFVFLFYLVVLTGMVKKWTISLWFSFCLVLTAMLTLKSELANMACFVFDLLFLNFLFSRRHY